MSGLAPLLYESIEGMDRSLARLARASGAMRLGLGVGLETLGRSGGHHELGFASVEAYALERCERSARWVQETRGLARRLEALPAVRRALMSGEISFSMAQVVAKAARAEDEMAWLVEARRHTVRQLRLLAKQRAGGHRASTTGRTPGDHVGTPDYQLSTSFGGERVTLTVTVDREDAWLFECSRMIVREVGGLTLEDAIEALLGEGTTSLLARVRQDAVATFDETTSEDAQRQWEAQLSRWREEAEERCEARFRTEGAAADVGKDERAEVSGPDSETRQRSGVETRERYAPNWLDDHDPGCAFAFGVSPAAIDAELRRIASELSKRDLELGRVAEAFWKADGWRRLGYATAAQYARERLGASWSSIKAKRALARRAEKLPDLSMALAEGSLGYEAARLVAMVATPATVKEWVARAAERTVRFLREEVDAVQMFARLAPGATASPPSEATMMQFAAVEGRIVSGEVFREADSRIQSPAAFGRVDSRIQSHEVVPEADLRTRSATVCQAPGEGQMSADLAALLEACEHARRVSPATRHSGRVTLRFQLSADTRRYYRSLERLFARHGPARVSFVRFLCCALLDAWKHSLGRSVEYASVYRRDRYRCASPVCGRRDITPHHLKFRSAGGDDSDENVASLCVWCHLEGIHDGRLRATPPASDITWTLGRTGHTVVRGRRREIDANVHERA